MKRLLQLLSATALVAACAVAFPATRPIELPTETVHLRVSELPGYRIAVQACAICHSADYIAYQPPSMTKMQWTTEVAKMQHAYGAPISDEQVSHVGIYLASAYGDASTVTAEDRAQKSADPGSIDAMALLNANGCLGCHQIKTKVVGPAYHDVASKYQADPKGLAILEQSIRNGSVGKWGAIPMPAFASLSEPQVHALAKFILQQ